MSKFTILKQNGKDFGVNQDHVAFFTPASGQGGVPLLGQTSVALANGLAVIVDGTVGEVAAGLNGEPYLPVPEGRLTQ